jgi:hypothetical protein
VHILSWNLLCFLNKWADEFTSAAAASVICEAIQTTYIVVPFTNIAEKLNSGRFYGGRGMESL